jgi:hypothetical protein
MRFATTLSVIWTSAILVISGTSELRGDERGRPIGELRVSGSEVFLNGRHARGGETVRDGDNVSTGPHSSALIELSEGRGEIVLNESTDPTLKQFWSDMICVIEITLGIGEIFADGKDECQFVVKHSNVEFDPRSAFDANAEKRSLVVTVLRGGGRVTDPVLTTVKECEQLRIVDRTVGFRRCLSPMQLKALIAWRLQYSFEEDRKPRHSSHGAQDHSGFKEGRGGRGPTDGGGTSDGPVVD